ncbi:MAG: hypothetical protein VW683_10075 [Betaproteobacteria bacterium]
MIKKTLKGVMWWLAGDVDSSRHKVWCNSINSFKEVDMVEERYGIREGESQFVRRVVQNNVDTNKDLVKLINNINVIHDVYDKEIEELKQRVRSLEKKLNKIDGWDD